MTGQPAFNPCPVQFIFWERFAKQQRRAECKQLLFRTISCTQHLLLRITAVQRVRVPNLAAPWLSPGPHPSPHALGPDSWITALPSTPCQGVEGCRYNLPLGNGDLKLSWVSDKIPSPNTSSHLAPRAPPCRCTAALGVCQQPAARASPQHVLL